MAKGLRDDIKIGLLGHFLAALIFLLFLEPIASALGRILLGAPSWLVQAYQDRLYSEIATGSLDYAYVLFMCFILLVSAAPIGFWIAIKDNRRTEQPSYQPRHRRLRRSIDKVFSCVLILITLFGVFIIADQYVRLNTISSFNQYVTILTPHITDIERTQLLADFASMRGRRDYLQVMMRVQKIAATKKIRLPANKLYPLLWD